MNALSRSALRATLRTAARFDEHPVLRALISRDVPKLPPGLDEIVAGFLSGGRYYLPSSILPQSVADAVKTAYRFPPTAPNLDIAFLGMRYLHALLNIGVQHGLISGMSASAHVSKPLLAARLTQSAAQQAQARHMHSAAPLHPRGRPEEATASQPATALTMEPSGAHVLACAEPGALLVAHPLTRGWAGRAVVLLCAHSLSSGAYGLVLNRALPVDNKSLREVLQPRMQLAAARRFQGPLAAMLGGARCSTSAVRPVPRDRPLTWTIRVEVSDQGEVSYDVDLRNFDITAVRRWAERRSLMGDDSISMVLDRMDELFEMDESDESDEWEAAQSRGKPGPGEPQGDGDSSERACPHCGSSLPADKGHHGNGPEASRDSSGGDSDSKRGTASEQSDSEDEGVGPTEAGLGASEAPILEAARAFGARLSAGGPVPGMQILHRFQDLGGHEVLAPSDSAGGLYLGGSVEELLRRKGRGEAQPEHVRWFVGECAWDAAQLEGELRAGVWLAARVPQHILNPLRSRPAARGEGTPRNLWRQVMQHLGGEYTALAIIKPGIVQDLRKIQLCKTVVTVKPRRAKRPRRR